MTDAGTTIIHNGKRYVSKEPDKKGGFFAIHADDDDGTTPYLVGIPRKGKIDWEEFRRRANSRSQENGDVK